MLQTAICNFHGSLCNLCTGVREISYAMTERCRICQLGEIPRDELSPYKCEYQTMISVGFFKISGPELTIL